MKPIAFYVEAKDFFEIIKIIYFHFGCILKTGIDKRKASSNWAKIPAAGLEKHYTHILKNEETV